MGSPGKVIQTLFAFSESNGNSNNQSQKQQQNQGWHHELHYQIGYDTTGLG
jgi:hypothetical protein